MIHEHRQDSDMVEGSTNRSFGTVFLVFFGIVALLPCLHGGSIRFWALAMSLVFLGFTLFAPQRLTFPNQLWQKFGILLGRITTPIVMSILFYLVITPMALLRGKKRRAALGLDFNPSSASYWIDRQPPGPDPKTLNQQF